MVWPTLGSRTAKEQNRTYSSHKFSRAWRLLGNSLSGDATYMYLDRARDSAMNCSLLDWPRPRPPASWVDAHLATADFTWNWNTTTTRLSAAWQICPLIARTCWLFRAAISRCVVWSCTQIRNARRFGCSVRPGCSRKAVVTCLFSPGLDNSHHTTLDIHRHRSHSHNNAQRGLSNCLASVRLSVLSIDRCSSMRRVCCLGPRGQAISIDCCTARLQQARPPFDPYLCIAAWWRSAADASSVMFPAAVAGWTHRLVYIAVAVITNYD